ncbi:hypothetical protein [Amycolatopsis orientalis]|uniref:hypothetical protein n=1 Tax=Amycolatopsis orientalis TaxID=31958 RepID=UPI00039EB71C|nr:hypothetical protein [Amycolatopsis orientalis]
MPFCPLWTCETSRNRTGTPADSRGASAESPDNPFAVPSDLPYELPPFDRISDEHYRPAFEAGLAEHAADVESV